MQNDQQQSRERLASISTIDFKEEIKPLLRGWSHLGAAVAAVITTVALLAATVHDIPRFLSILVFGVSMSWLYSISATYHVGTWRGRKEVILLTLDHASIFVLIAGTYTPICVNILSGWLRPALLILIWALALAGVGSAVLTLRVPRWALATLYVGMGWVSIVLMPEMVRLLPLEATLTLLAGGVSYTAGALVYMFGRPNPFPRVFGFHEIFHLFVIGGSVATTLVIWFWVVPFPRV